MSEGGKRWNGEEDRKSGRMVVRGEREEIWVGGMGFGAWEI